MPRKIHPRRGWYPPGLTGPEAITDDERHKLVTLAREVAPSTPGPIADRLADSIIAYRLMRQQEAGAPEADAPAFAPQAPSKSEIRAALRELRDSLAHAWICLARVDTASRDILELAYGPGPFEGDNPRPRRTLAALKQLARDVESLHRLYERSSRAVHLDPPDRGPHPMHALRSLSRAAIAVWHETTSKPFQVGRSGEPFNRPAHWVACVVKIADSTVTESNLRTVFRGLKASQKSSPGTG